MLSRYYEWYRMLATGVLLLQERVDAYLGRRSKPPAVKSPAEEQALERHRDDFLASDPYCRQHRFDRTHEPWRHLDYYRALRDRVAASGVVVEDVRVEPDVFADWLDRHGFLRRYYRLFGDVVIEKCLEHHIAGRELGLSPGDIYIDMASAGSPWTRLLRRRGIQAYRLDLIYRPGIRGVNIGGDMTATGLPDGFVQGVSIQCAFELLSGDGDRQFIEETARILARGGRAVITPLYLDSTHFVLHSPEVAPPAGAEEPGAVRVWRDDAARAPYSRHYSPEAFAARIATRLPAGLSGRVVFTPNLDELNGHTSRPADLLVLHLCT